MNPAIGAAASAALPGGDVGNKAKAFVYVAIAILVIVVVIIAIKQGSKIFDGIFGAFGTVGEKLGIKDTAAEKAVKEALAAAATQANSAASPFNPTFYKKIPAGTTIFSSSKAATLAHQIYDSVGTMYDDPESGFAAFKQCTSWAKVSQLCDKFNELFGKDAYDWLTLKYDTSKQRDTLLKITNYCFALPKY